MAHEILEHDQMISGRNITPWHELGEVKENISIDDLHRIMGWPVEMVPLITADGDKTDSFASVRKNYTTTPEGIIRTENIVLGAGLSKSYSVLQNNDLIKIVEPFVDAGCALETAGTLKNGQRVWILMRLAKDLNVGNDDVIQRYIMASNDHTGRQSAKFGLVGVRVVCQNTLNIAESRETSKLIRIYHQGDVAESMKTVASMLDHVNGEFVNYGINLARLAETQISVEDLKQYVRDCFFERFNEAQKSEMISRIEKRENNIIELFEAGAGSDLKSAKGTVYGAYQAVNSYLNHYNDIALDSRLPSLVWGHRSLLDKKALRLATKLAA